MERNGFRVNNWIEEDVLYLSHPVSSITKNIEVGNGITVKLHPETNEFLGFIWIDYNKRIERILKNEIK